MDARGMAGEEDDPLTCRIASANNGNLLLSTKLRFNGRRPVVNASPFIFGDVGHVRPPVRCAAGDDHRASGEARTVVDLNAEHRFIANESQRFDRNRNVGPELLRLYESASRQRLTRDPGWEAEE